MALPLLWRRNRPNHGSWRVRALDQFPSFFSSLASNEHYINVSHLKMSRATILTKKQLENLPLYFLFFLRVCIKFKHFHSTLCSSVGFSFLNQAAKAVYRLTKCIQFIINNSKIVGRYFYWFFYLQILNSMQDFLKISYLLKAQVQVQQDEKFFFVEPFHSSCQAVRSSQS